MRMILTNLLRIDLRNVWSKNVGSALKMLRGQWKLGARDTAFKY